MKTPTQSKCSKCGCPEVLRFPGAVGSLGSTTIAVGATVLSGVPVTRFVCSACGFVEEWIDNAIDLKRLVKKYGGKRK